VVCVHVCVLCVCVCVCVILVIALHSCHHMLNHHQRSLSVWRTATNNQFTSYKLMVETKPTVLVTMVLHPEYFWEGIDPVYSHYSQHAAHQNS